MEPKDINQARTPYIGIELDQQTISAREQASTADKNEGGSQQKTTVQEKYSINKPSAETEGFLASFRDPSNDVQKPTENFGAQSELQLDNKQNQNIDQLAPQRLPSPKITPVLAHPFTDIDNKNYLNISHAIENVLSMLDIESKAEIAPKMTSMHPIQFEASKDQSSFSNLPIPAFLHSSHDFSNSTSQVFDPLYDDQEGAGSKTELVDSLENGRFQMFNHQISHSKYRTIFQGVDNETGCEIAWSCYLLQSHDTFKKEALLTKLRKVRQITTADQTDSRAKYILRVIYFELRPAKHQKILNINERKISRLNTSTKDSKLISSRASHKNLSTALSMKTKTEADNSQNTQEQLVVVTELTTTGSLREYLRKIQHPRLKVIKEWLLKILEAVNFLHQNDIVHGKITCESIYYNSNVAEIKVGDIGIKHIYAQAQVREDANRPMPEQLTKQNDVKCIGMALLEMILTPEIPQNAYNYIKKILAKTTQEQFLSRISDPQLQDFIAKVIYDPPSKRPTCEELLQHQFLQVKPDDKEIEVKSLHTLGTLEKDSNKQIAINQNNSKLIIDTSVHKEIIIDNEPTCQVVEQTMASIDREHQAFNQKSNKKDEGNLAVQSARESVSPLNWIQKSTLEVDNAHLKIDSRRSSGKKKIQLKRIKSEFIKEETNERTGSSGNVMTNSKIQEVQKQITEDQSQSKHELPPAEIKSQPLSAEQQLTSIQEANQDASTLLKSVNVSQQENSNDILKIVIDVQTKDRMFTVTFEYDLDKDNIETLARDMKQDLNFNEANIEFFQRKINKAVTRYMNQRERERERTAQFVSEKAIDCQANQLVELQKFSQLAAVDLKCNKHLQRLSRQSSQLRHEETPRCNERRSDEKYFDDNLLSIRPDQCSEEPDVPTSPQLIDMSQVSHLSEQDQDSAKETPDYILAPKEDQEGTEKETKNNALIQHSQVMEPHNNTTGEMHEAIIREQQQNGPIGGRDVVANQCFRNSLTYVDQELQSFMYNSNDQKKKNEMLQAEKEKERDRSNQQRNQKKARDEEIAFQQIIHDIKEMFILEAMFPNYAREYHEIQDNQSYGPQTQEQLEANSHHQSMPISSPRHNTTNEIFQSLSFESRDHRMDNFHPSLTDVNSKPALEDPPELQGFNDISMIFAADNEIEFLCDLNTLEESKHDHKNIGNQLLEIIKARQGKHKVGKQQQILAPHATQSYISDGLGMSSLFEQSNLTKDRQNVASNIPSQNAVNSSEIHKAVNNPSKAHANYELKSNKTLNLILQDQQKKLHQPPVVRKTSQYQNESEPFDSRDQASSIKQEFLDTPIPQSSGSLVDSNRAGLTSQHLTIRPQSSGFVETSTLNERGNEDNYQDESREESSSTSGQQHAQKLLLLQVLPKDVKKANTETAAVETMSDQAIQQAIRDIYAKLNDFFSQPMQSERLEAKFKKMKRHDIISLRVALTLILPTLIGQVDDVASEISHSTNFESIEKLQLMNAEPSGQLFCKKTRRVIRRFKKVHGMVADSVVDNETWEKIMLKAKDILPVRINEQAMQLEKKDISKYSSNQKVLLSLQTFYKDFESQFKKCAKPDSKQPRIELAQMKTNDEHDIDLALPNLNAMTPLNNSIRRAEDCLQVQEQSKLAINRCQSMKACSPLFQTVVQNNSRLAQPTTQTTVMVQRMSAPDAPDLLALQRAQELQLEQMKDRHITSKGQQLPQESSTRQDAAESFGAVQEASALSQSGTDEMTFQEVQKKIE